MKMEAQLLKEMVHAFRGECKEIFEAIAQAPSGAVVASVEFEVRRRALACFGDVVGKALVCRDRSWERKESPTCRCGNRMRMVCRQAKTVLSVLGPLALRRRYYRCDRCGASRVPFDEEMGLNGTFTSGAQRLVSLCGSRSSFAEGARQLRELSGLQVSRETVRTKTLDVARQLHHQQRSGRMLGEQAPLGLQQTDRVYVTLDGTSVNTVEDGWREMKLGAIYDQSKQRKHYVASLARCGDFGRMLRRHAGRVGVWDAGEKIAAGDGAGWIWRQIAVNFPSVDHEVLDYYHLAENIHKAAWTLYGDGSRRGRRWAGHKLKLVSRHGGQALIRWVDRTLKRQRSRTTRQALNNLLAYLKKHARRMQYPQLHAAGIDIGTGPLESACKNVIGQRLKGRGMRWKLCNVEVMARLRALLASTNAWDAFWDIRAQAA